jgi:hypothetical protein
VEQASGEGRRRPLDLCITPQTSDERLNDSRTPRFVKLTGAMPYGPTTQYPHFSPGYSVAKNNAKALKVLVMSRFPGHELPL